MELKIYYIYVAIMAVSTYIVRVIPFVAVKGKIKNRYVRSFMSFIPYTVLGAMTFPAVFFSTASLISAIAGCIAAVGTALLGKDLLKVALSACGTVLLVELIMTYLV